MFEKVIVIGSGLGGLTTAYMLQKNGFNVTVLEQDARIGGCLQCFFRDGVKYETGMHFIGSAAKGQTMDKVFKFFHLSDDLKLSQLDTNAYNIVSFAGEEFEFANGGEAFIEKMSSYFPKEKDGLRNYLSIVNRVASASSLNSLTSEQRDMAANTEYQTRSINNVLDMVFKDEMLKNVLVGDLPLYSAELDKTPFSLHAFVMDFYNKSAYRVEGGSDSIAISLAKSIKEMGGEILTGKKAVKVVCDDNKAVGVETEDETFYPSDYVISTVHPNRLLEMLDTKMIRPAFRSRISSLSQTASIFALYAKFKDHSVPYMNSNLFGYSGQSPWNCERYDDTTWPKGFLYMHMCHEDKAEWARNGVAFSYMNFNDLKPWFGTRIGHRGRDYEDFKTRQAERLIEVIDRHRPGFASAIESFDTSTPLTYFNYTGTEDGSMYGVAKDINLGAAGRVPYRTKIPNLFLAGQNTNSHGIMGVIVGTIIACAELVPAERIYRQINMV